MARSGPFGRATRYGGIFRSTERLRGPSSRADHAGGRHLMSASVNGKIDVCFDVDSAGVPPPSTGPGPRVIESHDPP